MTMPNPNSNWATFAKSVPDRFAEFDVQEPPANELSYVAENDHGLQSMKLWRLLAAEVVAAGQQPDLGFGPFVNSLSTGQIQVALSAFTDHPTPRSKAIKSEVDNLLSDYLAATNFPTVTIHRPVTNTQATPAEPLSFSEVMARVTQIANQHETTATNAESQRAAVQRAADAIDASGLINDRQELSPEPAATFSELMATVATAALLNTDHLRDQLSVEFPVVDVMTEELSQSKHIEQRVTGPRI